MRSILFGCIIGMVSCLHCGNNQIMSWYFVSFERFGGDFLMIVRLCIMRCFVCIGVM